MSLFRLSVRLQPVALALSVASGSVMGQVTRPDIPVIPSPNAPPPKQASADSATDVTATDAEGLVVAEGGLSLYPRWSRAFRPLAELSAGEVLTVDRDRGGWKQVTVASSGARGWVYVEVAPAAATVGEVDLPLVASPTTSGLVVKGFAPREWSSARGGDDAAVLAMEQRQVDPAAYLAFATALGPIPSDGPPEAAPREESTAAGPTAGRPAGFPRSGLGGRPPAGGSRPAGAGLPATGDVGGSARDAVARLRGRSAMADDLAGVLRPADEAALGRGVAALLLAERPPIDDERLADYVSLVGTALVEHTPGLAGGAWFAVVTDEAPNAFNAPGGYVFVTTGALDACQDEAQLAFLLAHELAHLSLRHALRSLDRSSLRLAARDAVRQLHELTASGAEAEALAEDLTGVADRMHAMTSAPYDAELEREADVLAMTILTATGYDPRAAAELLEGRRMSGPKNGLLLSSHPSPELRAEVVRGTFDPRFRPGGVRLGSRFASYLPR